VDHPILELDELLLQPQQFLEIEATSDRLGLVPPSSSKAASRSSSISSSSSSSTLSTSSSWIRSRRLAWVVSALIGTPFVSVGGNGPGRIGPRRQGDQVVEAMLGCIRDAHATPAADAFDNRGR
jgi:hypothetical protein